MSEKEEGSELFDAVYKFLGRFVAYPTSESRVAHVLWIAHTWFMDEWEGTPRLAFLSPEPGSGKTRALEVTAPLVCNGLSFSNVSPAYLFRRVSKEDTPPTVLFDEIDAIFGPKANGNEDLRSFLNAGHRKGARIGRCLDHGAGIEEFDTYCAVALAGLGYLPDTIATRSVIIRMRRRKSSEQVEQWRIRTCEPEAIGLHDWFEQWASQQRDNVGIPMLPNQIRDRNADVWEPLIAVADLAGGAWPQAARTAAITMTSAESTPATLGAELLIDIHTIFESKGADRITSGELVNELNMMEESPWGDLKGRPMDTRRLARMLKGYGIHPQAIRIGGATPRGYLRDAFIDAWERYLPARSLQEAQQAQHRNIGVIPTNSQGVPADAIRNKCNTHDESVADVADTKAICNGTFPCDTNDVAVLRTNTTYTGDGKQGSLFDSGLEGCA